MIPAPRLLAALALLVLTHPGLAYELEKRDRVELLDAEIRANLQGEEPATWEKLQRRTTEANQQIARGKDLTSVRKFDFKGSLGTESPEARKARGDAEIKAGEGKLAEIEKERAELAKTIESRIRSTAVRVPCPLASLRNAFTLGATELTAAAKAAGYTDVAPAGILLTGRGGSLHDPGMSALLVETLKNLEAAARAEAEAKEMEAAKAKAEAKAIAEAKGDAPKAKAEPPAKPAEAPAPAGPAKPAWIVGEIRPCESAKGAIVSLRLVDAETGLVRRAMLALVPADANDLTRRDYNTNLPISFRATLEDTQNFFSKLGKAERWVFEVQGEDAAACVARATLAAAGAPALSDIGTLKRLRTKGPTKPAEVKAHWTTAVDPETKVWRLNSHITTKGAKSVPVGRIDFSPTPAEKP